MSVPRAPQGAGAEAIPEVAGRELLRIREGLGPWGGRVTVTAVKMHRRSRSIGRDVEFEVTATWTGPPMVQPPEVEPMSTAVLLRLPEPEPEATACQDSYWTDDQDLAVAIARQVEDELRIPRVPDLREIAAERRRA